MYAAASVTGNVLLLRGAISLSEDVGVITADQLISLVANHLLESNKPVCVHAASARPRLTCARAQLADPVDASAQARAIQDAIHVLPRLLQGLDVNVRFNGCVR